MATVLIRNGFFTGALMAMNDERSFSSGTPGDYATVVNAADAFAAQCLTANTALGGAAMADADNANIFLSCMAAAMAKLDGRASKSSTATDYAAQATAAVGLAKQSVAKLT